MSFVISFFFQFNYHEFMEAWRQSVPEGMHVDESHLQVLGVTDNLVGNRREARHQGCIIWRTKGHRKRFRLAEKIEEKIAKVEKSQKNRKF